jgi:hypothetical protein
MSLYNFAGLLKCKCRGMSIMVMMLNLLSIDKTILGAINCLLIDVLQPVRVLTARGHWGIVEA